MSSKILREALLQQKEIEDEARKEDPFSLIPEIGVSDDDDSDFDDEYVDSLCSGFVPETDETLDYNDYEIEMEMLEQFMSKESSMSLPDRITNRIEKGKKVSAERKPQMDNRLVDIYKGIGEYLSRYTSGKLPKAFLSLPSKPYWEDALYLTEPEKWSANAMWQATNIFDSNMTPKRAQRFYYSVFIVRSSIQKVSLPADNSSVALMHLAEMEYCGTTSFFWVYKKYALPCRALDAVVGHFMRFLEDSRVMPVIWHQALQTLVQRFYELTKEDKENLERLIQHQKHHLITEDIRGELRNSWNRGEKKDPTTIFIPWSYHHTPVEEDRFNYPIVPMEEE
ncbi:hypothetical protein MKX03_012086 [Papaver bracteatum]|nr:hypothetical protein MKX03_012086 [Papaver bracteatum]